MSEPVVRARNLTRTFAEGRGVRDATFEARAGEILAILGPNGAGKTTLMRVLMTLLAPTSGSFEVAGAPGTRPDEVRARIGVLPESNGYYGNLTGRETLVYFAQLHGMTRRAADARAVELLGQVGLAARGGSLVRTYSRGMRQRLGIARALVHGPQVLLLDEPTLGLDPSSQEELLGIVRRVSREGGVTTLLSTHQLEDAEDLADAALILRDGTIVAQGPLDELRARLGATRRVRALVPASAAEVAKRALAAAGLRAELERGKPGLLLVDVPGQAAHAAAMERVVHALADAGVAALRVEQAGSRLSDAFFAHTRAGASA